MKPIDPTALFRLSVLGPLVSRAELARGELQQIIRELATRAYDIPGSGRERLGEKTIQAWYYAWRREGIAGLERKARVDQGRSRMSEAVQAAILAAKREKPSRSIRQIRRLLEFAGTVPEGAVSRSAIHRLLAAHGLSRVAGSASEPEERRRFRAEHAGSIWYGDVMHGPHLVLGARMRKTYLVSLLDDASRLVAHSAFCLAEGALEIEGVLKQAVLKRGLPGMLVVDQGAAYRASTLQGICARLGIRLVHCRPYHPESKGKLERYHRTLRSGFLDELDTTRVADLHDLNARLWAWVESVYHRSAHEGLDGLTPLARYQQDLARIRTLGLLAARLDELFWHRVRRFVRKDATVSFGGRVFEVPYELAGKTVQLVVDPHAGIVHTVEGEQGQSLGKATALDAVANLHRRRHKPQPKPESSLPAAPTVGPNLVELAHARHFGTKEG